MKRLFAFYVLASVFLLCWASNIAAQGRVALGLRAGVNLADASTDPEFPLDSRTGLVAGGIVEIGLSGPLYLQLEPRYAQKGAE